MLLHTCVGVAASAVAFGFYVLVAWPWFLLGWVGWIPWFLALERAATWRQALWSGWLMSLAYVGAVFWWFAVGIADYTGSGVPLAALALALIAPLVQPQIVVTALVFHFTREAGGVWLRPLAVAGAYCGSEWAFPRLFGDTIGHGFQASPLLRQAADIAGASGLTFLLLLSNQWILASMRRLHRGRGSAAAPALAVVATVVALSGYGAWRLRQLGAPAASTINAAVVQAGLSHYTQLAAEIGTHDAVRRILDAHFELSSAALGGGGVDLLVWPETVYPTTFGAPKSPDGAAFDEEIAAFVTRTGVPLVFGAYDTDAGVEYNAAFFVEPAGDRVTFDTYRKGALFPLTERVPWPFDTAPVRRWMPWLGTWTPGASARVVDIGLASGRRLRTAPLICYDAVDPDRALDAARQGAEVIVTLSNDSWFAAGGGPRLHLVVSAFRTLETRLSQVRATNTGISAFITPAGDIIAGAGVGERAEMVARLPLGRTGDTLMVAWGDWFGRASCILAVVCGAVLAVRRRHHP